MTVDADPGSFRDPSGRVFYVNGRVFRTVTNVAAEDFEFVRNSGLIDSLTKDGLLIGSRVVSDVERNELAPDAVYVIEHDKVPFVSYPYEWSFAALKAAALLHLDVHLSALDLGVTMSDASAYNVQFLGHNPVFIDILSFTRYREGETWKGHRQFCEQFLNPLLLRSELGVTHNAWYRGTQEGIPAADLRRLLPWWKKLSRRILLHVVAQTAFQSSSISTGDKKLISSTQFPLASYRNMLTGLRKWIETLAPANAAKTTWEDYAGSHSYDDDEVRNKTKFIAEFVASAKPAKVWDLGCNVGDYSKVALDNGAATAIGFDFDIGALEIGFARAKSEKLNFLPLFFDGTNPSPDQGWWQRERKGFSARADADAIMALAFIHHIAIGRNIPIEHATEWLMSLAPRGVIEFVPKQDPMVQELLSLREDIFPNYTEEYFLKCVEANGKVERKETVTKSGRLLVAYSRD